MSSPARESYRPALDGIRALAVASVFAYHLGYPWAGGGFLGVDVFFVLSGYLITGLLLDEGLAHGRIRLGHFWARRARRLLPAVLVLLVAVAVLVRWLLPASEWGRRQDDIVWALFYAANWHQVAAGQDYFGSWTFASPLRHMWSLAIEEQFYLVWPVALAAVMWIPAARRRGLVVVAALAAVTLISSAALMWWLADAQGPSRAYYGTDSRAQELMVGALLAVAWRWSRQRLPPRAAAALALIGLAGVLTAIHFLTDAAAIYYLGGALGVSLLAAALIAGVDADSEGLIARAFALAPVRELGKMSYGLYLWHWPAIVYAPLVIPALLGGTGVRIAANPTLLNVSRVALALTATVISYHLIEQPVRRGHLARFLAPRRILVAAPATAAVALATIVLLTAATAGATVSPQPAGSRCDQAIDPACLLRQTSSFRPTMVLLGDSTAKSLVPALLDLSVARDWTFVDAAHDGCSFLQYWVARDGHTVVRSEWQHCYEMASRAQAAALSYRPAIIIATDRWLLYNSLSDSGRLLLAGTAEHERDVGDRLGAAVNHLTADGARLVLIHVLPPALPAECALTPVPPAYAGLCAVRASADRVAPPYNAVMDRVAAAHPDRVRTIDLAAAVCPGDRCAPVQDGVQLRYDPIHFTPAGAHWLEPALDRRLRMAGIGVDG